MGAVVTDPDSHSSLPCSSARAPLLLARTGDLEESERECNHSGGVGFIKEQMKRHGSCFRTDPQQQSQRQGLGACAVLREGSWKQSVRGQGKWDGE